MKLVKKYILMFALIASPFFVDNAYGQLPPTAGTPGPTGCFPPPCVPIDGGLSLLIAAGIGIAGKKAYEHANQGDEEDVA